MNIVYAIVLLISNENDFTVLFIVCFFLNTQHFTHSVYLIQWGHGTHQYLCEFLAWLFIYRNVSIRSTQPNKNAPKRVCKLSHKIVTTWQNRSAPVSGIMAGASHTNFTESICVYSSNMTCFAEDHNGSYDKLGLLSISYKTSYRKISSNLKAVRFVV